MLFKTWFHQTSYKGESGVGGKNTSSPTWIQTGSNSASFYLCQICFNNFDEVLGFFCFFFFHPHFLKILSCCPITFIFFFINTILTVTYVNCDRRCWLVLWLSAHWGQRDGIGWTPLVCLSKTGLLDLSSFPCKYMTFYLKMVKKSLRPRYL